MKTLTAFLFTILLAAPLRAQETAPEPLPGQEPQSQLEKPISLIPETAPAIGKPKNGEPGTAAEQQFQKSRTIQSEADLKQRIRLREVKTIALKDPAVQRERERAEAATTEREKREALRSYYERLHTRILKIDGSLADLAKKRLDLQLAHLSQSRIEPPGVNDEREAAARNAEEE